MELSLMEQKIYKILHKAYASFDISNKQMDDTIQISKKIVKEVINYNRTWLKSQLRDDEIVRNSILERDNIEDDFVESLLIIPEFLENLSVEKLERNISNSPKYIKPREYQLDVVQAPVREDGKQTLQPKRITIQYFNILDTLRGLLSEKKIFDEFLTESRSSDSCLSKDIDGSCLKHKNILPVISNPEDPNSPVKIVARLVLYGDAFQVANPLGSKTKPHDIQGFYIKFLNMKPSGKLKYIFIHTLARTEDVQKYGRNKILQPFIQEMVSLLETDNIFNLHGRKITINFLFAGVIGDTLDLCKMFSLIGPSGNVFCKDCLIVRLEFHQNINFVAEDRTLEHYRRVTSEAKQHPINSDARREVLSKGGYNSVIETNLTKLNFDFCKNRKQDRFHDLFEGVTPVIIIATLRECLKLSIFNVTYLNSLIKNFDYGKVNDAEKPSANITNKDIMNYKKTNLRQNGIQTHLLARTLPFLIFPLIMNFQRNASDTIKQKLTRVMEFYGMHLEVLRYISCHEISNEQINYLEGLVLTHNQTYVDLYRHDPDASSPLINKFHHLQHYARMMREYGPAVLWETTRYESLNRLGKLRMDNSRNFKNAPKTIADRFAIMLAYQNFYHEEIPLFDPLSSKQKDDPELGIIYEGNAMSYNEVFYQKHMVICTGFIEHPDGGDAMPIFGEIINLVHSEQGLQFSLKVLKTIYFDTYYCAYSVEQSDEVQKIFLDNVASPYPLALWKTVVTNTCIEQQQFVSVKTAEF